MTAERSRAYTTRPRYVPPELANDERLEECSELAALLMYRVVTLADDQGRLPGSPRQIRGLAFAMRPTITERKVAGALAELVAADLVLLYEVGGRRYVQIREWWQLQGRLRRSYPSRYPAPSGWTDRTYGQTSAGEVPADSPQDAGEVPSPRADGDSGAEPERSGAEPEPSKELATITEGGATESRSTASQAKPARHRPGSPAHRLETQVLLDVDPGPDRANGPGKPKSVSTNGDGGPISEAEWQAVITNPERVLHEQPSDREAEPSPARKETTT